MNLRLAAAFCALGFCAVPRLSAAPFTLAQRSQSASRQFIVYCDDLKLRLAVSSYTEETKATVLRLLEEQDKWKIPVVITLRQPDPTQPGELSSEVKIFDTDGGTKIELNVTLAGDLKAVRFPRQFMRALLLEMEYRKTPVRAGDPIIEPPAWLVEGLTAYIQNRGQEMDSDIYKTLLDSTHLPAMKDFLVQNPAEMNAASLKLYQTYSLCLVQLLLDISKGRGLLANYIRDLPAGNGSSITVLQRHFPMLGASEQSMEKWWSLSVARLAASDRYKGMSIQETEQQLTKLLKLTLPADKKGGVKNFAIEEFSQFVKIPQARKELARTSGDFATLSTQANPLFRPIVAEYQQIVADLQKGKTRHIGERLHATAKYRELLINRMDQIDDYLNWFEATQVVLRSDSFADYMRTAKELSEEPPKREDAISHYLDSIELESK
jgi:hypothetical protein